MSRFWTGTLRGFSISLFGLPDLKATNISNKPDLKAHAIVARQAAADGMVLLKNSHATLPLSSSSKNLAAFGNTSYEIITGGTGSGDVNEAYSVSLVDGLKGAGFAINEELQKAYGEYIRTAKAKSPQARPFSLLVPVAEMAVVLLGSPNGRVSGCRPDNDR